MKLRFGINQAEAFRRGIDAPKSVAMIEVDPSKLTEAQRQMIADRLKGIDVCQLKGDGLKLVNAVEATWESLLEAVRLDQQENGGGIN